MVKRERSPSSLRQTNVTLPPRNSLFMNFGFKQHWSDGVSVEDKTSAMFMVPDSLSLTNLLNSSSSWNHQQGEGSVQPYSYSAAPSAALLRYPPSTSCETICQQQQRSLLSSIVVDKPADDGYNWRKYGQKQVKGSEYPRSYYKCTLPNCPVKKKVERSIHGHITEIIYKGKHNHLPHQSTKVGMDITHLNGSSINHENLEFSSDHNICSENLSECSDPVDEDGGQGNDDKPIKKRSSAEVRITDPVTTQRTVMEPKIIVQTTSEIDLLDDGYRWRKYGRKIVKGSPYPRSYYKCTNEACKVRKHVERAASDPKAVVTTYEGIHNHNVPASRISSHITANNDVLILTSPQKAIFGTSIILS